jgi:2-oxoglutarate ferredoxin oxidoreductase subunit beta
MSIMDLAKADTQPAWCPACGNYAILKTLNEAVAQVGIDPRKLVLVSGIGQAAKLPHYVNWPANVFNGQHGRAVPAATGIKLANHELEVVITSGDGDMYGEGGNHLIHAMRRNIGLKAFVHNNQVYGLTKGQASPTSDEGFVTKIQTEGVMSLPLNPLALAITEGASWVGRSFTGLADHLREMMVLALKHPGFCLLDILQPCVSFNHVNTYRWYKERAKLIGPEHDPKNRAAALDLAGRWGQGIPIGVIYECDRPSFESRRAVLQSGPLVARYPR